jgi:hypothetical protein
MSFASEIATVMNANSTINALVDGIYRETTSTEFNATKNWIIYTYKRENDIAVLGNKNFISEYTFYTEVYTDSALDTETISELLRTYLNGFTSNTIRDITYLTETHSNLADANDNIAYVNLMEFSVIYQN